MLFCLHQTKEKCGRIISKTTDILHYKHTLSEKAIVSKCVYCMCALHFNLKQTFLTHVKSFSIVCVINVGVKTTGMEHNLHILKLVEVESPQF